MFFWSVTVTDLHEPDENGLLLACVVLLRDLRTNQGAWHGGMEAWHGGMGAWHGSVTLNKGCRRSVPPCRLDTGVVDRRLLGGLKMGGILTLSCRCGSVAWWHRSQRVKNKAEQSKEVLGFGFWTTSDGLEGQAKATLPQSFPTDWPS